MGADGQELVQEVKVKGGNLVVGGATPGLQINKRVVQIQACIKELPRLVANPLDGVWPVGPDQLQKLASKWHSG
jgi:hypothetical protein